MSVAGIIVEYNPLHNGHVHHIQQARRQHPTDVLIAVMSGGFTQRGEPAMLDKFTRTTWALAQGIDLVVELPFVHGVQSADHFAEAAVSILAQMGVTDIHFGSETADIDALYQLADTLDDPRYEQALRRHLDAGLSYPTASDRAMHDVLGASGFDQPNNILGIQYLRAGKRIDPTICFHAIPRIESGYYDRHDPTKSIQSATAIRALATAGEDITRYVPAEVAKDLAHRHLVTYDDFTSSLQGILHRASADELGKIHQVTEGLEHRLKKVPSFDSIEELLASIISRRYTHAKLQRMLAHVLCNVQDNDLTDRSIGYLRILGMSHAGRQHLNALKKTTDLPLLTKIKEGIHPHLDIEIRVSKVYSIASDIDVFSREFQPVIF
jgi:predicted nucleotidyltransferase